MATGNRKVNLSSREWTQVTSTADGPFRLVNQNKAKLLWWTGLALPVTELEKAAAIDAAVTLNVDESMSRFAEMEGLHLYMMGSHNRNDDYVVIVD